MRTRVVAIATMMLAAVPLARGQEAELLPRWKPTKDVVASLGPGRVLHQVSLKLADDVGARAEDGRLVHPRPTGEFVELQGLLASVPGAIVEPRFTAPVEELQRARERGQEATGQELADLSQYFWVHLPRGTPVAPLLSRLHALGTVENAYTASVVTPPPGDIKECPGCQPSACPIDEDCTTPNLIGQQTFRLPAPYGLGFNQAATAFQPTVPDLFGDGITVGDIEHLWFLDHEDLMVHGPTANVLGEEWFYEHASHPPEDFVNWGLHGTAVVGLLSADPDLPGVAGLVHGADLACIHDQKVYFPEPPSKEEPYLYSDVADAILRAVVPSTKGGVAPLDHDDVLLLEAQTVGPNNNGEPNHGLVPVEFSNAEFDAIRQATALGILVVEAAGNGAQDLDAGAGVTNPAGKLIGSKEYVGLFDLAVRDSGAIIVTQSTSAEPHLKKAGFTTHGERVDTYAWGETVLTLGRYSPGYSPFQKGQYLKDGDGNPIYSQTYGSFSGSSAASPLVTAAVVMLDRIHDTHHGTGFHSLALRLLLRSTGTPSANGDRDRMGAMPNVPYQGTLVESGPQLGTVHFGTPYLVAGNQLTSVRSGLADVGDVDDDGFPDFGVGAPLESNSVTVRSGRTGRVLWEVVGPKQGSWFGYSLCGVGDQNGDGHDDVAVGAPLEGPPLLPPTGEGRVHIVSGATGEILPGLMSNVDGWEAPDSLGRFGSALAAMPDLTGDGRMEVVVGSPNATGIGAPLAGRVSMWSPTSEQPLFSELSTNWGSRRGSSLLVTDLDGTGNPEIVVGAPGGFEFISQLNFPGRVECFTAGGTLIDAYVDGTPTGRFGTSLACLPVDVMGENVEFVAVGEPGTSGGAGGVRVLGLLFGKLLKLDADYTGTAEEGLGWSMAGLGDLDGDGLGEVLVGGPDSDAQVPHGGRAVVLRPTVSGGASLDWQVVEEYVGLLENGNFGHAAAALGDVSLDQRAESLIGARLAFDQDANRVRGTFQYLSKGYSTLASPPVKSEPSKEP